jgi:hypothetical protein
MKSEHRRESRKEIFIILKDIDDIVADVNEQDSSFSWKKAIDKKVAAAFELTVKECSSQLSISVTKDYFC